MFGCRLLEVQLVLTSGESRDFILSSDSLERQYRSVKVAWPKVGDQQENSFYTGSCSETPYLWIAGLRSMNQSVKWVFL